MMHSQECAGHDLIAGGQGVRRNAFSVEIKNVARPASLQIARDLIQLVVYSGPNSHTVQPADYAIML